MIYAADDRIVVTVRERPKTVTVLVAGRTSRGRWNNQEEVFDKEGPDAGLLKGAMTAWGNFQGTKQYECSYQQLAENSGGWLPPAGHDVT